MIAIRPPQARVVRIEHQLSEVRILRFQILDSVSFEISKVDFPQVGSFFDIETGEGCDRRCGSPCPRHRTRNERVDIDLRRYTSRN